jgi:hypothetical protein
MGVSGQRHIPAALTPRKTHIAQLLYGRLGGPEGRSGRVRKILLLLGFHPRSSWNYERKLKRHFLFDDDFHLHVRYTVEP